MIQNEITIKTCEQNSTEVKIDLRGPQIKIQSEQLNKVVQKSTEIKEGSLRKKEPTDVGVVLKQKSERIDYKTKKIAKRMKGLLKTLGGQVKESKARINVTTDIRNQIPDNLMFLINAINRRQMKLDKSIEQYKYINKLSKNENNN